jgi:hypothetical protein
MTVGQMVEHMWQNSQMRARAQGGANIGLDAVSGVAYSRDPNIRDIDYGIPGWLIQQLRSHSRMPVITYCRGGIGSPGSRSCVSSPG